MREYLTEKKDNLWVICINQDSIDQTPEKIFFSIWEWSYFYVEQNVYKQH